MDDPIFVLTGNRVAAANELLDRGIPRHQFQSPYARYRIVTSPDHLHGMPRGLHYCVIGTPRHEVLEMAWVRDGEEVPLP